MKHSPEQQRIIRAGKGPYYLEIETYRYRGHSVSDPAKYRTKEELEAYKEKDPLVVIQDRIVKQKIASQKEVDDIIEAINKEIDDAMEFAENSPYPLPSELYEDNYSQKDYPYITD
jgi:pyruvate dehydrogenase E1 component alpha subunit